jgi:hypothetical protein
MEQHLSDVNLDVFLLYLSKALDLNMILHPCFGLLQCMSETGQRLESSGILL